MATRLGYFTFTVPDTARGTRFYGDLFGWSFHDEPSGDDAAYRHIDNLDFPGGLVSADPAGLALRPYFRVDDIHRAVEKVEALSGTSQEPFETDSGRSCLARDDQGVAFGHWQPAAGL